MFRTIPVIGLSGGIGSGKSFVGQIFAELNCVVISSDELVREAYDRPAVQIVLREWWGESVFRTDGTVNRREVAERVFQDSLARERLERLLHPLVDEIRLTRMNAALTDPRQTPKAFVWDSPLLFETGLDRLCDVLIFVDAPLAVRLQRVAKTRGWSESELIRRENSQIGLDKKREMSNYSLVNTADAEHVRDQVRELLPRIIERVKPSRSQETTGLN